MKFRPFWLHCSNQVAAHCFFVLKNDRELESEQDDSWETIALSNIDHCDP